LGMELKDRPAPIGGSPPRQPPKILRPRKSLPEVPKHRHGVPVVHPSVASLHVNGTGQKKQPPKIPPPRRRAKLLPATGVDTRAATEALPAAGSTTPVS
jgi:hypothetical protein